MQGIDACPKNEDVWLEAARLQTQENARALLARGVQSLPTSVKLWMQVQPPRPPSSQTLDHASHLRVEFCPRRTSLVMYPFCCA